MTLSFLKSAGWDTATRQKLAGDASTRRYERLTLADGRTALLCETPSTEEQARFLKIREHLAAQAVSVPAILATDPDAPRLLLEDFGETSFGTLLANGADAALLYGEAVALLADLHGRNQQPADVAIYDPAELLAQMSIFQDHYPIDFSDWTNVWVAALETASAMPQVMIHRDFHIDNLFWLADRHGTQRVGLIDFQDAAIAPAPYDLVSLLKDARCPALPQETVLIDAYLAARPENQRDAFQTAYAVVGAVRNIRILGIFVKLAAAGKPHYLDYLPTCWVHVEASLAHPALSRVNDWFSTHFPTEMKSPEWFR